MSVYDDLEEIWNHSHYWNWSPDWLVVKEVYEKVPNSYSVLMPFAYSYFEEMIRTTTSEYCIRCGSKNIDKLMVNTRMKMNYPEKKSLYSGTITQRVIEATDALVCKDCGHIELFIDWKK